MEFIESTFQNLRYIVRYPNSYKDGEKYPVIIFLHGAGTRGSDINILKSNSFFAITGGFEDFPFICVAPHCESGTWFDYMPTLKALAASIASKTWADNERIYLIGNSMGGYGTWQLAMSAPELFAAIVPIFGGGMSWNTGTLVNVPVWAFHGADDTIVYPEESERMVAKVIKYGGQAKLTVYPNTTHDSWTPTFKDPKVYAWLLEHKNSNAKDVLDKYKGSAIYG